MVLSCLTRCGVGFQGQQTGIQVMQLKPGQRRELWPPAAPGSKASCPRPAPWNQGTRTSLEHRNPSRSQGSVVREEPVLTPLYHKWPSSQVLQLQLVPPALAHTCSPGPLKPLTQSSEQDGFEAPSYWLASSPSINLSLVQTRTFETGPFEVSDTRALVG